LKEIIADYTPEEYNYEPDVGDRFAKRSDYDNVDVIPVSDPNAATMAQKIVQMQAVQQMAQANPGIFNMPLLNRQMLEVLGVKDAEKLVPMDDDQKPLDPVTENQNIITMKPVKAFLYQNHQAHIAVHMSAMQDPKIQQLMQNNPAAQTMMQAMLAHVNEHAAFEYRRQIEQQLGMPLPAEKTEDGDDNHLMPEVEARLSPLLAQAAQRLLQMNQQQAAQQQAQKQAQDPLIQMQMQELQIKAQEQQRKAQKDQIDAQMKAQQLQVEMQRAQAEAQRAQAEAMKATAQATQEQEFKIAELALEREKLKAKMELDEKKVRIDSLKSAMSGSREREKMLASLSIDVLKHLSDKTQQDKDRQQRDRQIDKPQPPKKGE